MYNHNDQSCLQIDSMLLYICSVIDHRSQIVVRKCDQLLSLSRLDQQSDNMKAIVCIASYADVLWDRHAIFLPPHGRWRLHDRPKECLCRRLLSADLKQFWSLDCVWLLNIQLNFISPYCENLISKQAEKKTFYSRAMMMQWAKATHQLCGN